MKSAIAVVGALILTMGSAAYAADTKTRTLTSNETETKAAEQRLEEAQARLEQAAREVAELSGKLARDRLPDNLIFLNRNPNRAMLGIGIGGSHETEVDDGVVVMSVSPGGPAAGAGLKAGDVVVELNGKSLQREKDNSPKEKLLDSLSKLSPGDEVTLKYTREGNASIAKLKVDKLPAFARRDFRIRPYPGDMHRFDFGDFDWPHAAGMMHARSFGGMELVPLTPKLAQYFGTDKGLLVVRAPQGKDVKLEDGDVLVDIDGRTPTHPGHAFRILGSYQPGEKLTLNILRQRKKMALAITVPESGEHGPRPPMPPHSPPEPGKPPRPIHVPVPPPV